MSEFVNFGKRGVELPFGCKDLIDVLQPKQRRKNGPQPVSSTSPKVVHDDFVVAGIGEVAKYVSRLFHSRAWMRQLEIDSLDNKLNVTIYATDDGQNAVRVWLMEDPTLETRLKDFLASHGLDRPPAKNECVSPISFVPNVPVQVIYPLTPVPAGPSALSNLVELLLRDVAGLAANSQIRTHYFEAERQ